MSLEQLQYYVRLGGPAETLCSCECHVRRDRSHLTGLEGCEPCGGTGAIVIPQVAAILEALWEPCGGHEIRGKGHFHGDLYHPTCIRYTPRSRGEAALLLPDAVTKGGYAITLRGFSKWECDLVGGPQGHLHGEGDNLLDALSAAVEAWLKA